MRVRAACGPRVSDLRDVERRRRFLTLREELLVCNSRLRCNHPLIVLLFSNHLGYNLLRLMAIYSSANAYTCTGIRTQTHITIEGYCDLFCLSGRDLVSNLIFTANVRSTHLSLFLTPSDTKECHFPDRFSLLLHATHLLSQTKAVGTTLSALIVQFSGQQKRGRSAVNLFSTHCRGAMSESLQMCLIQA